MANHEIVPGSAFTRGTAERRKSATSFSLPGFACRETYSANFVIRRSLHSTQPRESLDMRHYKSKRRSRRIYVHLKRIATVSSLSGFKSCDGGLQSDR